MEISNNSNLKEHLVCSKVLELNWRTRQVSLAQNLKAGCTTGALLGTFVHKRKKDVVERQRNEVSSEHDNDTGLVFSIEKTRRKLIHFLLCL